ncbi:helix-turn-helix domain-containing protein [Duganella sp. BJB488]|uniref:helix-turn-helix domain-containing protein n=1 Tax=unclassified Duganella TaxID=2636909 RepID=UPI000E34F94E|nr:MULTISPECIES: helix-turn-helix domain-containing protein [unclassified Duganella]RFP20527.1 helix-turn-helix domain-containing protein [Duganella sp. BJB489]RFP21035.1 helix-turn-helix domain-containing protein [Duganella sp. BJB488]RFP33171.1 helix-turn-helix domain-containing protein [Duganella sp. BJB480]
MNSEWAEPPKDQGSSLATPGAQLAAQREAMGLTVEQIADQLKLAPRQVKALEAGDYAALPNMAVVRGFVRAYAKVVKIDATPLVAMIEVISPTSHEAAPPRKEIAATFTESRFPSMTGRSSTPTAWLVGAAAVVVVAAAGAYAYQAGLIPATLFQRADKEAPASAAAEASKPADVAVAPIETTLVKPGQETAPLQSPSVPLISVPPQGGTSNDAAPAAAQTTPPAAAPAPAPATPAPAAPVAQVSPPAAAPVAASGSQLVLKVTQDSWVEIRRPGTTPLISRLVKAGSTETFDIKDPALLIVGKPGGVEATLGGAPLALPPVAGGTISRVNIK